MSPVASAFDESLSQFIQAWRLFALRTPRGEFAQGPGLTIASANSSLPTLNACFLTEAAEGSTLEDRVRAAREYFADHGCPGLLVACIDLMTPPALATLEAAGATLALELTGMAADELEPPARELPAMEFRRVNSEDTRFALADMNCISYGMPIEWGREAVGGDEHWNGENFGHVGYINGQPVTAAATMPIDGRLYVGWVATLPGHRQRGYAEAIMRHSLAEAARATGLHRTVLHATPAGFPVYARMGYIVQRRFACFGWGH